jgi:hypothetical protein
VSVCPRYPAAKTAGRISIGPENHLLSIQEDGAEILEKKHFFDLEPKPNMIESKDTENDEGSYGDKPYQVIHFSYWN